MAKEDGTIYIKTKIGTAEFKAGSKELEAAARKAASSVSGIGNAARISMQKQLDAFVRQNQLYAQQEQKVESLKSKLKELSSQKIETQQFKDLGQELAKLDEEYDNVTRKMLEMRKMGFPIDTGPYSKLKAQLEGIKKQMQDVEAQQKRMKASGSAYTTPDTSGVESKLLAEKEKLRSMNSRLETSFDSLNQKASSYNDTSKKLITNKKGLIKSFGSMISMMNRMRSGFLGVNKSADRTRMTLGRMFAMSLLFSTAFRAITLVTSGLGSGINNLAQYSGKVNASLSSMMSVLTQLKNSFATAFAPILTVVAPILTTFINMLSRAITYVGMFIASLTGQKTFTKAVAVQQDYAASLDKTSGSANKAAKATKKANKANKDYLSGLDEIRKFQSKDSDTSSPGGAGAGGLSPSDMFQTVPIESSIANMAKKIKDLIKTEDWEGLGAYIASGINKGLQKIYNAINWNNVGPKITYFVNAFTRTFNSLVDNIDWDLMGRTVGAGINTIVNTANLLIEGIDWSNLGKSFATGIMGIVKEVNWTNLGNLIGNYFMISWKVFYGFVNNLDYEEIGESIADGINGILEKLDLGMIASSLSTFVVGILNTLSTAIKNTNWEEIGQQIANALRSIDWFGIASGLFDVGLQLINGLLKAFGQLPVPVQIAGAAIGGFFTILGGISIVNSLITALNGVISVVGGVVAVLGGPLTIALTAAIGIIALLIANWDKVKSTMEKFDNWLQGVFKTNWTAAFGVFGEIAKGFMKNVQNIWNALKTTFKGIITFIQGVFTGDWKKAWTGLKTIVKGVFQGIVAVIKAPVNAIISIINTMISGIATGINAVIDGLNSIQVPEWVPGIGGKGINIPSFNPPKIPYLASGAVIPPNAPFMAMLGDQKHGNNIETPESLLRKIVREETGTKESGGQYRFTAQINRRTLFDEMIEEAKIRQTNNGRNPFELV